MKCAIAILTFLLTISVATALEVRETLWGYDGQVEQNRFNLLSVLVANPAAEVFDAPLVLSKSLGLGGRVGTDYTVPCYVAGRSQRWVQFYVYVSSDDGSWLLAWGRDSKARVDLAAPRLGLPAVVLLTDPENPFRGTTGMKAFPDHLFPPTVTATDGLGVLVMDYAPRWEPAKRVAFLDWVQRGGRVHLLKDDKGAYPQFPDELAALNSPLGKTRIGAGAVIRHATTRRSIREEMFREEIPANEAEDKVEQKLKPVINYQYIPSLEDVFTQKLGTLSRPKHNWGLIYLLNLAYLVLIGPVNYLLGRKWRDYRLTILFFLGSVAGFAVLFAFVGRQGYGDKSTARTLSYARSLGSGQFDVTQWCNIFVNSGATYTVTHEGDHHLYSTGREFEAINGQITNGKEGKIEVDIPIFSSRGFVHRVKQKTEDPTAKIVAMAGVPLTSLQLAVGPGFPRQPVEVWAFYQDRFYPLVLKAGRLEVSGNSEKIADFLAVEKLRIDEYNLGLNFGAEEATDNPEAIFRHFTRPLIARSLGVKEGRLDPTLWDKIRSSHVQLFVLAKSPDSFRLKTRGAVNEIGYVLYHQDVFPEEKP